MTSSSPSSSRISGDRRRFVHRVSYNRSSDSCIGRLPLGDMFDKLTERLGRAVQTLRGRGRVTEDNVAETLREVRMALLEADVALPVVKRFIDSVKTRALGAEVAASLTPGQAFIGILHRELVALLGGVARLALT